MKRNDKPACNKCGSCLHADIPQFDEHGRCLIDRKVISRHDINCEYYKNIDAEIQRASLKERRRAEEYERRQGGPSKAGTV